MKSFFYKYLLPCVKTPYFEANIRIIKTVRLQLDEVKELLQNKTLKIILLHRDPRGVMNSRLKKGWCSKYIKVPFMSVISHLHLWKSSLDEVSSSMDDTFIHG